MTRSSGVSEEVWAKAIHAVKVQKMSLRQAAQLYGVHHMSLHRRVRGRYTSSPSSDVQSFLTPDDEAEVLGVLREQFLHEKRITSDDIRFVVRAIASQGGKRSIPPEFPPSRWIMEFKRSHGFVKLNSYAYPPSTSSQGGAGGGGGGGARGARGGDLDEDDDTGSCYSGYSRGSSHTSRRTIDGAAQAAAGGANQKLAILSNKNIINGRRSAPSSNFGGDRDDFATSSTNGSLYDTGLTTGSSSGGSYENGESEKRTYKLSHTVPPETWEKAIAAVEQQGMSLRAAAKMYAVHFAALHRRVKKRAQGDQASGIEGYFQPDDEAGIIRVVVARAELGVLMTFDELMDLVQRAALRNLPDLSVEAARKLMTRFQTRNEHSIRHIITDWPLPRANPIIAIPRVVNNQDFGARSMGTLSISSSVSSSSRGQAPPSRPPSPPGLRGYMPSARSASMAMNEPTHARMHPQQQQQRGGGGSVDLHHSPLPSLSAEFPPPPPASSIFARHAALHNTMGASGAQLEQQQQLQQQLQQRRVPQPLSADHRESRYVNHGDRDRRDRHQYNDNSSYDECDDENEQRGSGDGSSEGDAVMFV